MLLEKLLAFGDWYSNGTANMNPIKMNERTGKKISMKVEEMANPF